MKNVKKILSVSSLAVVLAMVMLMFTGCTKTSTTTDAFKTLTEESGLITADATAQFAEYDFVKEVTLAISEDQSYQFEFYVLSDQERAKAFFEDNKNLFEESLTGIYSQSSVTGKNYAQYSATTDTEYKFIEYIDTTVLYINVDKAYKNEAEDFIKGLGY